MYKVTVLFNFGTELYFKGIESFSKACELRNKFLEYAEYDLSLLRSVEVDGESFSFRLCDLQMIMITKG